MPSFADRGNLDAAIHHYRKAIELDPADHKSHGNLLFALSHHTRFDGRQIRAEAEAFGRQHSIKPPPRVDYANVRDEGRRLRIGYVSPDFRQHSVAHFLSDDFRRHDRSQVDLVCYSNVSAPDSLTEVFVKRPTAGETFRILDDTAAAKLIRDDRIDILVDVAMHMTNNRRCVCAKTGTRAGRLPGLLGDNRAFRNGLRFTEPRFDPPGDTQDLLHGAFDLATRHFTGSTTHSPHRKRECASSRKCRFYHVSGSSTTSERLARMRSRFGPRFCRPSLESRIHIPAPPGATVERVRVAFESHGVNREPLDLVGRM